jgi:hypothetical protein
MGALRMWAALSPLLGKRSMGVASIDAQRAIAVFLEATPTGSVSNCVFHDALHTNAVQSKQRQ